MKTLWPNNGHIIEVSLEQDDEETGEREPATGLTVTGRISTSPTGAAIGSLTVALTEYAQKEGTYHGELTGLALAADLAATDDGTTLYEVIASGSDILISTPILFRSVRHGSEEESCA